MKTITVTDDEHLVIQFALILYAAEREKMIATKNNKLLDDEIYQSAITRITLAESLVKRLSTGDIQYG